MKTWMTGGVGGSCSCCFFIFLLRTSFFLIHFPFLIGLSFGQRQPEEGWQAGGGRREPPAVACSMAKMLLHSCHDLRMIKNF